MRITGLRIGCVFGLLTFGSFAPAQTEDASAVALISKLASSLSQNDSAGALAAFDSHMKDYGTIQGDIEALVAQSEVLCAIDIVEDQQSADGRRLDVDWYMQLKSLASQGPTERRRERVAVEMKQIKGKWKITSVSPLTILAPIHIG
jgi:hypothetical protein